MNLKTISNGDGHLFNGTEEGGGGWAEEGKESDHQRKLKSNGYP